MTKAELKQLSRDEQIKALQTLIAGGKYSDFTTEKVFLENVDGSYTLLGGGLTLSAEELRKYDKGKEPIIFE